MYRFTKQEIQNAIELTRQNEGVSMRAAAKFLNIKLSTFKKYALQFDLWLPNQGGKGRDKPSNTSRRILLEEILAGLHPHYQTFKLKNRLISENQWEQCCSNCKLFTWLDNPIPLELDHIDGNRFNHKENNLRLLCPNCHALTTTYCGKNIGSYLVGPEGIEPSLND